MATSMMFKLQDEKTGLAPALSNIDLNRKDGEMKTAEAKYQLIDDRASIKSAISDVTSQSLIAVDCEGVDLGRKGQLTILSVGTMSQVYIFDILKLGKDVFHEGLRDVLEDKTKEKLMFDCRRDSDCLWHQFNVKLSGVLDLQLLEVINRMNKSAAKGATKHLKRSERLEEIEHLNGYLHCIEEYVGEKSMTDTKKKGRRELESNKKVWETRPISETLLEYCCVDTCGLFTLYEKLEHGEDELPRLRIASQRYCDLLRDLVDRTYDEYENHAFLPLDVIPEKGSAGFPFGSTKCIGCRRLFPREEFSKNQLSKSQQKCRVCKKVKLRIDVQRNREDNWLRDAERDDYRETYYSSDEYDFFGFRDDSDVDEYVYDEDW